MRLEIRSARTTLNPTRQGSDAETSRPFFPVLALSLSLSLPPSLSSLRPLALPSYLPTYLLPTYLSHLILHVFVCNHVLLEDSAACAGMVGFPFFYYFPFQSSIKDTPLSQWTSHVLFFLLLRPIPHSCYLPNFPTLFSGTIVSLLFSISIIFYSSS